MTVNIGRTPHERQRIDGIGRISKIESEVDAFVTRVYPERNKDDYVVDHRARRIVR